jgi:heat shock protein HtpX
MEWGTDWGLKGRMVVAVVLIFTLPFAFAYTMLYAMNTLGVELLRLVTNDPVNGRFYIRPWLVGSMVLAGFVLQYALGKRVALRSIGATQVDGNTYPDLTGRVERLAAQATVSVPDVAVSDDDTPNAFTIGRPPFGSTVVVTEGLLETLDDDELDAVLAHELAHVANRDATVMTLAYFLPTATYLIAMVAFGLLKGLFQSFGGFRHANTGDSGRGLATAILVLVVSSVATLAISVLFWLGSFSLFRLLSRYREYAADRGAAAITGEPLALASALQKIDEEMDGLPEADLRDQDGGLEALYVAPIDTYQFGDDHDLLTSDIFPSTHPKTENRVEELEAIATEGEQ